MQEASFVEVLEKEKTQCIGQIKGKLDVAEVLIKAGDLLIAKDYLRQAFLLNKKANQIDSRLKIIQESVS